MREVEAIILLDKKHVNNNIKHLIFQEKDHHLFIKIKTFNNYRKDDETVLHNIYHHLFELGIDVYNIEVNILWNEFTY
ncbi:hypothetical protein [Limnobaculum xujianqingii]|uniref:hypothetical protein n=1 Tax=Limnobaculum xujianqingii TaxID=2738837 RepID=UPI001127A55E|nr:hypothetical protein [Limnobaculum xujianqingii]